MCLCSPAVISVIYLPLLSICPSCLLITYSIMSLPALRPSFSLLLSLSFIFRQFPLTLILPLGVFSLAASRSIFCYNQRLGYNNCGSDPALSAAASDADVHPGQDSASALVEVTRGHYGHTALVFICLSFVLCLSRLLVDPWGCVPGPSGNDCSDPGTAALHTHYSSTCVYSCFRPARLRRIFYEFMQALVNGENEATSGVVQIFSSPADVLRGTLTLAVCWQAGAPIDHSSHSKQTQSSTPPPHRPSQRLRASDRLRGTQRQQWARNPELPS